MILTLPEVITLDRPMLGLDLETTGVNPMTSRIVEIGLEIMSPGKETRCWRSYVNPGIPIPPGATAIHKITDDMVADAPRFEALADKLLAGFAGSDFAGYNVRFDLRQLSAEFKRVGKTWDYEGARVIDAFRLWQIAEGRSLENAVDRWLRVAGTDVEEELLGDAHTAMWDIKMSTRVIAAQLKACQKLPRDLQMLHDLCSPGWYDAEGKLQWKNGNLCISFGEHKDKPLRQVPASYLKWITTKDFSRKVKDTCHDALRGVYPQAPASGPEEEE